MTRTIGFIGGTGPEGKGLAARFAAAGLEVVLGSRSAERGEEAALEVAALTGGSVHGATNVDAARAGEIVIVTVPYAGQRETLAALKDEIGGKIVVSAVVPLRFTRARIAMLEIEDKSAGEEAQKTLPGARIVGAFHNLSASHLLDVAHPVEGDVIICSDDAAALQSVIELTGVIKELRGVNGGPLANCRYVEGLTALLLNINRIHHAETHVRVVGI